MFLLETRLLLLRISSQAPEPPGQTVIKKKKKKDYSAKMQERWELEDSNFYP